MTPTHQAIPLVRTQVVYQGRVQGVGFRATAAAIAQRLAVTGWVRNELDGSVCLEAQGPQGQVEELLMQIAKHQGCRITGLVPTQSRPIEGESTFEIRPTENGR